MTATATRFAYTIRTTSIMEHSHGVAWTASLLLDGRKVGTVEQLGDGGSDRVDLHDDAERLAWRAAVQQSWPHLDFWSGEEYATYHMMEIEDEGMTK